MPRAGGPVRRACRPRLRPGRARERRLRQPAIGARRSAGRGPRSALIAGRSGSATAVARLRQALVELVAEQRAPHRSQLRADLRAARQHSSPACMCGGGGGARCRQRAAWGAAVQRDAAISHVSSRPSVEHARNGAPVPPSATRPHAGPGPPTRPAVRTCRQAGRAGRFCARHAVLRPPAWGERLPMRPPPGACGPCAGWHAAVTLTEPRSAGCKAPPGACARCAAPPRPPRPRRASQPPPRAAPGRPGRC